MRAVRLVLIPSLVLGFAMAVTSPGSSAPAPPRVTISAEGAIGPLHIDRSTRAAVVAFAGRPEAETRGRYANDPPYDALGYGCAAHSATTKGGSPLCRTVFYVNAHTGRLSLFWTQDPRFTSLLGVHVGTSAAAAERATRRTVYVGCLATAWIKTKRSFLVAIFAGGSDHVVHHPSYYVGLDGGHADALVVESWTTGPGVLDCIDS